VKSKYLSPVLKIFESSLSYQHININY